MVTLSSNVQVQENKICMTLTLKGQEKEQGIGCAGACVGWLLAGASSVVYSAWDVQHECKTVFFSRFYTLITREGLDVAQSLHSTQKWLREATQLEYLRGFPKEWQSYSWSGQIQSAMKV